MIRHTQRIIADMTAASEVEDLELGQGACGVADAGRCSSTSRKREMAGGHSTYRYRPTHSDGDVKCASARHGVSPRKLCLLSMSFSNVRTRASPSLSRAHLCMFKTEYMDVSQTHTSDFGTPGDVELLQPGAAEGQAQQHRVTQELAVGHVESAKCMAARRDGLRFRGGKCLFL